MVRRVLKLRRWAALAAGAYVLDAYGCFPNGGLTEVAAENIVRTINLYTSSLVSLLFLNFNPFFGAV